MRAAAEWVPIERLLPWVKNPRVNDPAVDPVATSITKYGFGAPLVARLANGEVIAGHTRLKAAVKLGLTEVPVRYLDLTEAQAHELALADNRLGEIAEWDEAGLRALLETFEVPGSMLDIGWSVEDLQVLVARTTPVTDDEVPLPPAKPRSKLGSLVVLGRHRLLCGDATSEKDVGLLLGGAKPELLVTDPPYGVEYDAAWRDEAAKRGRLSFGERRTRVVRNDDRVDWTDAYKLAPARVAYVWCATTGAPDVCYSLEGIGYQRRALIVWAKTNFVIGRGHYHYRHELCWYHVKKGDNAGWIGDRSQQTVWDDIGLDRNVGGEEGGHSTQKPLECMARPIRNHKGDVYDPFCGSGTTVIAAERLGRTCYAMELDPVYCDVIIKRWENETGKKAVYQE